MKRFCSKMIKNISDLESRRQLVFRHISNIEKEFSFSSYYYADTIIADKIKLYGSGLNYDQRWYHLFSNDENNDMTFIENVTQFHMDSSRYLFEKELNKEKIINDDEMTLILKSVNFYHEDFYRQKFSVLIEKNSDLLRYLWMSIKQSYMTSGNQIGYQLAKNQFLPGMEIDIIKDRIDNIDIESFTVDEIKVAQLFVKAYNDGFKEGNYYNIKDLELMNL